MQFIKKENFSFGVLFIEVFSIIFGVLLALGVNEIRKSFNDKELINTALESITIEIQHNKDFLSKRLPYYNSMNTILDSLINKHGNKATFSSVSVPGFAGFNPPLLRNSSLQTAMSTQVFAKMDYNLADKISWGYSLQETYLKWIYLYLNAFANTDTITLIKARRLFGEMTNVGTELDETYSTLLKELRKNKSNN